MLVLPLIHLVFYTPQAVQRKIFDSRGVNGSEISI